MQETLDTLAKYVNGTIESETIPVINGLSSIDAIIPNTLVFANNQINIKKAENSEAAAILIASDAKTVSKPSIRTDNPLQAFIKLLNLFYPPQKDPIGIHPTAVIGNDVTIGDGVSIGPFVTISSGCVINDGSILKAHTSLGYNVRLGKNTILHPNVTIYNNCELGNNVVIHAGTVIGADGFGYQQINGSHQKMPHVGNVVIEDNVEIGAGTIIDRATIGSTVIGKGTKIDNLVQIAHSVKLGEHNIVCAFTGIAGSTKSGNNVVFAANVGVSDHVQIEDEVILGARTGVPPNKHLKKGNIYLGNPARPKDKAIEHELGASRISGMRKQLKKLQEEMQTLKHALRQLENNND